MIVVEFAEMYKTNNQQPQGVILQVSFTFVQAFEVWKTQHQNANAGW